MRRFVLYILALTILGFSTQLAILHARPAQQGTAPTLVPPTPIPQPESGEAEILPSESAVARIQANGVVRVGMLYNAPPFGELNIRGRHSGYDADLARSMAEAWGVEVEFVQVTRDSQASAALLRSGEVDLLVAAQVHRRELDALMEFSQTYYLGQKSVMVRADDPAARPNDMAGRTWGVTIATPAERAVQSWMNRSGVSLSVQTYLTLDRAYVALAGGEIDGVVDSDYRLRRVAIQNPELTRLLEEPIELEPFTIAVLRQDSSMRDLVNRTLQHLTMTGRMQEIHQVYFPGEPYDFVQVWENLGEEAPTPDQYPTNLSFPTEYVVPRIQANRTVRVAGLFGVTADSEAPESERRLDTFHRALLNEMASRWGATVEFVPDSRDNALDLVASGQADIAVGVEADWNWADRVDFTGEYLLHGERLMVRIDDEIRGFADLRGGRTVVTPVNEADAAARAVEIAETVNARIEIEQQREQDLGFALLANEELDADAVFGDSLKLISHVQANPDTLELTLNESGNARWYSQSYMSLAVPENDIDFRLLVQYTLQELVRDGTLDELLQPLVLPDDVPTFEIWPGPSTYLSFSLGGS